MFPIPPTSIKSPPLSFRYTIMPDIIEAIFMLIGIFTVFALIAGTIFNFGFKAGYKVKEEEKK